jgi:hypothetical protein
LLKDAITPWNIERRDLAMLLYKIRDPFVMLLLRFFTDVNESY